VGGGILVHGVPALRAWIEGQPLALSLLLDAVVGIAAGAVVLAGARGVQQYFSGGRRAR
jgi:hypothetical protein